MDNHIIFVRIADQDDAHYAEEIIQETEQSAIARGSGIAKRTLASVIEKMAAGKEIGRAHV